MLYRVALARVDVSDGLIASIIKVTRFGKLWVWNGVHSALLRVNEELLERKVEAPV
jgi:hypothetical protein